MSILANIKTVKNPFKIPNEYFETVTENVFLRIADSGFEKPKDYFDSLEDAVFERIKHTEKSKVFRLPTRLKLAVASAAALLVLYFAFPTKNVALDTASVIAYLEDTSLDNEMITDFISTSDLTDLTLENIDASNAEAYLNDNIDNIEF